MEFITDKNKRLIGWVIVTIAILLASTFFGVTYPIPPIPDDEMQTLGISHFSGMEVAAPTTQPTDEPAMVVDNDGVSVIFEVRDSATPVFTINDGGAFGFTGNCIDLDADGDTSICADTDDQIDFELAGVDTVVLKAAPVSAVVTATVNIQEIQFSSPAWTANTNNVTGLVVDISVGNANTGTHTVKGIMIDAISGDSEVTENAIELGSGWDVGIDVNGLKIDLDADADTSITVDTDDQVDIEISGADDFQFTANTFTALSGSTIKTNTLDDTSGDEIAVAASLDLTGLMQWSFADRATSDGDTITATVTVYALDTSGAVTITLAASADEGQLLVLINDDANATIIADTNIRTSDGNAVTMAGAMDITVWIYQDSEWLLLLAIANS